LTTAPVKDSKMRHRFEQQLTIGQYPIEATFINPKEKGAINDLLAALKEIYCNKEYNVKVFSILESYLTAGKKKTGRKGMDLWPVFVLAQLRLCLNLSYEVLHNLANNHNTLRRLMGIEREFGFERFIFEYQNIYDNVSALSDQMLADLNEVIVDFGHKQVFKKKENTALRLKSDSFVVESNVHFPTDYNLLWDCARKCLDTVSKFLEKYNQHPGWRKIDNWRSQLKGLMRELGKASNSGGKNKHARLAAATRNYLRKARALMYKLDQELPLLPQQDLHDGMLYMSLEHFMSLMYKHIDLVDRRILKGETIPHEEKLFSIFETYTEWVKKGKMHPNVELGKKLLITTDQYDLIVDYQILNNEQDRDIVIGLSDRVLSKYKTESWSFDKGFWRKENKNHLQQKISKVVMPKLGRRSTEEDNEEKERSFKRLKNKHSAIESNINELENRGLDRCPDRGLNHYKSYIGLGICAYNLKKIGRQILKSKIEKIEQDKLLKTAA
jgi:transposase, IS5 family